MRALVHFLVVIVSAGFVGAADEPESSRKVNDKKFVIGVGGAAVSFDSSFLLEDKATGDRIFLDPEGQLGLPKDQTVPSLSLLALIKGRHYIAVSATRFRRSSTLLSLEDEIDLGSLLIHDASVDVWLNSNDIDVAYGYGFYEDDRLRIIGKFGVYVLDLNAGVGANGTYSIDDEVFTDQYEVTTSLTAPLPLLGVLFSFDLSNRWSLSTNVDAMYLPIGDITGAALRTGIFARYAFSRAVGINFGISQFKIEVTDEDDQQRAEIEYGYVGYYAGLIFAF